MSRRTTNTTVDLVAASILLAAIMAVAACSGPSTPRVTPPPVVPTATAPAMTPPPSTPAPTPSPSATWPPQVALPTPPPEMSRDDEAGAVAAATYFLKELFPYTVSSHDTTAWIAMSDSACKFCASTINTVTELERLNRTVVNTPFVVTNASSESISPAAFGVFFDLETGPDTTYGPDRQIVHESPITRGRASIAIVRQGTHWRVLGVELEQAASAG